MGTTGAGFGRAGKGMTFFRFMCAKRTSKSRRPEPASRLLAHCEGSGRRLQFRGMLQGVEILKVVNVVGFWLAAGAGGVAVIAGLASSWAGSKLSDLSDLAIAQAQARAEASQAEAQNAKLQIARIQTNVGGRELTPDQIEILVRELRGKYASLGVVHQADAESSMYAGQWITAFMRAGIQVWSRTVAAPNAFQMNMSSPGVAAWLPREEMKDSANTPLVKALFEADLYQATLPDESRVEPIGNGPYIEIPGRSVPASRLQEEYVSARQAGFTLQNKSTEERRDPPKHE